MIPRAILKYFTRSGFFRYFSSPKGSEKYYGKIAELVKYFSYCTRNHAITSTYLTADESSSDNGSSDDNDSSS